MTKITIYRNKRNHNKYIEVHNDGHRHNSVRQFIENVIYINNRKATVIRNYTGDGSLHRWNKENLKELLTDYEMCATM